MNNKRYALIASHLWDGSSDHSQDDMAVLINGEKIEDVCPACKVPDNIRILRFEKGCTLLPGLIDAHVHYSPWMGPAFLAAGVTTVRDVGNDLDWILRQQACNHSDILSGPEIVCCGTMLDGPKPYWHYIGRGHADTDALRESIRQHAQRGIKHIKFYDGLNLEFIKEGLDEARKHNLWVLADFGTDEPKAEDAVYAGVNEIEHLTGCPPAWHKSHQSQQDSIIDVLLAQKTVMTPTLITYDHIGRALDIAFKFDSRRMWTHPTYLDIWQRIPQIRKEQREKFQEAALNQKRFVGRLYERQATLALGTDTPFQFIIPGFSVHDELSMYVDAGVSAVDALRSATSVNAALLGMEKLVGQIKPNFQADIIVVSSNPLEDIQNITNIECVVRRGLILPGQELKQLSTAQCNRTLDDPLTRDMLRYIVSTEATQKKLTS